MSEVVEEFLKLQAMLVGHRGVSIGEISGSKCLLLDGRPFFAQQGLFLAFKLSGADYTRARKLPMAQDWTPQNDDQPLPGWVALPISAKKKFSVLVVEALNCSRD